MAKGENGMSKEKLIALADSLDDEKKYQEVLNLLVDDVLEKHNTVRLYILRGISYRKLKEYDKAINDYNKALEIDANYKYAYNNRGVAWHKKEEYDKAIEDYTKAIKLDDKDAMAYNNRAISWEEKQEYGKAIEDYDKALELDPSFELAKRNRASVLTILGEKVEELTNDSYDLFNEAVKVLLQNDKIAILGKCKSIMEDIVVRIREHASANMDEELQYNDSHLVAHFTKLRSADVIINGSGEPTESRLRLYNAVYMNDPEEGEIILQCLDNKDIEECFTEARKKEENNIYIGSFLPAHRHEDELIMWRTYGKDEFKNEASGCSIVIDTAFFDKTFTTLRMRKSIDTAENIDENETNRQTLFRVLYYDKNEKSFVNKNGDCAKIKEDVAQLKRALNELVALKENNKSNEKDNAINIIVYHIISEVRYFFKSADYSFENEARVLQFMKPEDPKVKIDDNAGQWLPRRLYIESNKPILPYIRKIILGPKVPNPNQWIYLEATMKKKGFNISVVRSECKYQ